MENWEKPEYKNWGAQVGCADALDLQPAVLPREPQARTRRERPARSMTWLRQHHRAHRCQHYGQANVRPGRASPGLRRLRFTHRYTFLPMKNANPGCARVGTTFCFINDGPERALELARESGGSRDIRIAGGADVIQQYLNHGCRLTSWKSRLAPVLFGGGRRLFENLREPSPRFRIDKVLDSPVATHLRYVRD